MANEYDREYVGQSELWGRIGDSARGSAPTTATEPEHNPRHWKKLIIGAAILSCISIAVLVWLYFYIFRGALFGPSVEIVASQITEEVFAGSAFSFPVTVTNFSQEEIVNNTLSIFLPDGFYFSDLPPERRFVEVSLKNLAPDEISQQTFSIISTAKPQQVNPIRAVVTYASPSDPRNLFKKEITTTVLTSRPSVDMRLETPQFAFGGTPFDLKIIYRNNTNKTLSNLDLEVSFDKNFQPLVSTAQDLDPDAGTFSAVEAGAGGASSSSTYRWRIDGLEPGQERSSILSGILTGPPRAFFAFGAVLRQRGTDTSAYEISSQNATVSIYPSPLEISARLAGDQENVFPGTRLSYHLTVRNNADITFRDLTIRAQATGAAFNFSQASGGPTFDSRSNTFTWTVANVPELATIAPQESREVVLEIPLYSQLSPDLKNLSLSLDAQVDSPTVPTGTAAERTRAMTKLVTKIAGRASITARAYYKDPGNPTINSGPYPPKVNEATRYTVYWDVKNSGADLTHATVVAFLQSNTKFVGVISATTKSQPVYNPNTGQLSWDIGDVSSRSDAGPQAVFQIENVPAINQTGSLVPLIGSMRLTATDAFTGNQITVSDRAIDTGIPSDRSFSGDRRTLP